MSNLLYLAVAAIFVLAVAGFILRGIIGSAIQDQRQAAAAEIRAEAERIRKYKLEQLESEFRSAAEQRDGIQAQIKEARAKLPVWGKLGEEPTEEVLAYAKRCLKNALESRGDKTWVDGAYRIEDFKDAPGWLDHVGAHYFYLEMAKWELAHARAQLEVNKISAKISKLEGRDNYAYDKKGKQRSKKTVAYLKACLASNQWYTRHYLNYCIETHKDGIPGKVNEGNEVPWNRIKTGLADRRATEMSGPKPIIPKTPHGYRSHYQLYWQTRSLEDYCRY